MLDDIALQHPDIRKATDTAARKASAECVVVTARPRAERESGEVRRPDDERLLVLMQKYVLIKSEAGREVQRIRKCRMY